VDDSYLKIFSWRQLLPLINSLPPQVISREITTLQNFDGLTR